MRGGRNIMEPGRTKDGAADTLTVWNFLRRSSSSSARYNSDPMPFLLIQPASRPSIRRSGGKHIALCLSSRTRKIHTPSYDFALPWVSLRSSKGESSMPASPILMSAVIQPSFQGCVRPSSRGIRFVRLSSNRARRTHSCRFATVLMTLKTRTEYARKDWGGQAVLSSRVFSISSTPDFVCIARLCVSSCRAARRFW
jgi:hypothetical protein